MRTKSIPELSEYHSVIYMYISELHLMCGLIRGCRVVLASAFTSSPGEISAVRLKFIVFLATLPVVLSKKGQGDLFKVYYRCPVDS